MSLKVIFQYSKQLSTSLNAALPINRALEVLARTAPTRQLRAVSEAVNRSIAAGTTLTQAFEKQRRALPDFFIRMIGVGERTGRLEQVTSSLAAYYEQRYEISRTGKRELYPILVYFTLLALVILLIEGLLGGTARVEAYLDGFAWVLLVAIAVVGAYYFSGAFRDAIGTALFYVPFVGRLVKKFSLSKFCEGMRLASETGLNIREAIELSAESSGNPAFRRRARRASEYIDKGSLISEALDRTGVFPFQSIQMFAVGEETGKIHEAMGHVSRFAREEALDTLRITLVMAIRVFYVFGVLFIAYKIVMYWSAIYGRFLGGY